MKITIAITVAACLVAPRGDAGEISKVRYKDTRFEVGPTTPLPVLAKPGQNITVIGQGVNGLTALECPPNTSCGVVFRNPAAPEIEFPLSATGSAIGQTLTVRIKYVLGDSNTFKIKVYEQPSIGSVSFTNEAGQPITEGTVGRPLVAVVNGNGLADVKRAPGVASFFGGVATSQESVVSATDNQLQIRVTPTAAGSLSFLLSSLRHPIGAGPGPGSPLFPAPAPPAPLTIKTAPPTVSFTTPGKKG